MTQIKKNFPQGFPHFPENWEYETETFECSKKDHALFAQRLLNPTKKNADELRVLFMVHGQGEHGGRYQHFPFYLKEQTDCFYWLDLKGHGRSEGLRGHIDAFDDYVDDVILALARLHEKLKHRHRKVSIDLFGHSMGGLIVLRALMKDPLLPIRSAVVSAPALSLKVAVPFFKKVLGHSLSTLWGTLQLETGLDASALSHDENVIDAYLHDRLVHSVATPRFFTEFMRAMEETRSRTSIAQAHLPLLLQIPLKDEITDGALSVKWIQELKHTPKKWITYPDFFHESYNEIGKELAFEDLKKWIQDLNFSN